MAKLSRVVGSTSQILQIFAQDSTSTGGAGLIGLVFNTSLLTCYYKRSNGSASVAVTLVNITTLGTYVSGGFKVIDATHMPGLYEFHPPNAAFASGADNVVFYFIGATNLAPIILEIELTATNNQAVVDSWATTIPGSYAAGTAGYILGNSVDPWETVLPGTYTAGQAGYILGNSVDPWETVIPGTYTVGQAGYVLGNNITVGDITAAALAKFFTTNTTKVYTDAVSGSVVKEIVSNVSGGSGGASAAAIATAVWTDLSSGSDFATTGSIGKLIADTLSDIIDPWTSLLPGTYTTGQAGYILGTMTSGGGGGASATAIWQDLLSSSDFSTAGSVGKLIKDNLNAPISTVIADFPANFNTVTIANNGVNLNLQQAVALSNANNTLGDCLNAARAQGFGKWTIDKINKFLYLYAPDELTVVHQFDLDSIVPPPTMRSKH